MTFLCRSRDVKNKNVHAGGHEYAWHGEFHIPCSPDLQRLLMAMKKERDAGVDDDSSVAVVSTAFTLL